MHILEDFTHPGLRYDSTERNMQFDFFVSELNLAVEYQGFFHFKQDSNLPSYGALDERMQRDAEKARKCKENGIVLVPVPYWWSRRPIDLYDLISDKGVDLASKLLKPSSSS